MSTETMTKAFQRTFLLRSFLQDSPGFREHAKHYNTGPVSQDPPSVCLVPGDSKIVRDLIKERQPMFKGKRPAVCIRT